MSDDKIDRFIMHNVRGDLIAAYGVWRNGTTWYRLKSGDKYQFTPPQMDRLAERLATFLGGVRLRHVG
jgi:hypothetical protein